MFIILLVTIALVGWSLHLMEAAVERKEFSLMIAGFLVASAGAALVAVYFLMGSYMGYMTQQVNAAPGYTVDSQAVSDWAQVLSRIVETEIQ